MKKRHKTAEIEVLKKKLFKKQEISNGQKKLEELEESILTRRKTGILREEDFRGEWPSLFDYEHQFWHKGKLSRYAAMEEQLEIRNAEYNSRYISFNSELRI